MAEWRLLGNGVRVTVCAIFCSFNCILHRVLAAAGFASVMLYVINVFVSPYSNASFISANLIRGLDSLTMWGSIGDDLEESVLFFVFVFLVCIL